MGEKKISDDRKEEMTQGGKHGRNPKDSLDRRVTEEDGKKVM